MPRSILDQNNICCIDSQKHCDEIIISPMFMWEFFGNIGTGREEQLIRSLINVRDQIVMTFKSITCEAREIEYGRALAFGDVIDQQNTQIIRQWLCGEGPSISEIRDKLSPGFARDDFMNKFKDYADGAWRPKLEKEFRAFINPVARQSARRSFEEGDDEALQDLCFKAIQICFCVLKERGYSEERAVLFLRRPSILYNKAFYLSCMYTYRSTEGTSGMFSNKKVANDAKDVDYLFPAHHAERLLSNDKFMQQIFLCLKKSYDILSNMETGL